MLTYVVHGLIPAQGSMQRLLFVCMLCDSLPLSRKRVPLRPAKGFLIVCLLLTEYFVLVKGWMSALFYAFCRFCCVLRTHTCVA